MTPTSEYWNRFEEILDHKRYGHNAIQELQNLSIETLNSVKDRCDLNEYNRLSNLFYHIQNELLLEYGVIIPETFPLFQTDC